MNLFTKTALVTVVAFVLSYACYMLSGNFLNDLCRDGCTHRFIPAATQHNLDAATSFDGVETVEIHSVNTDIHIKPSTEKNGKISYSSYASKHLINVHKDGKTLTIDNLSETSILTLSIPANVKTINTTAVSGDIELEHLLLTNLNINTTSGDITLTKVDAAHATIQTVSGDVVWNGSSSDLNFTSTSGDFTFDSTKKIKGTVTASSLSGDVNIPSDLTKGNETIKAKSVSGEINIGNAK